MEDDEEVEVEVEICEALLWPSMFFISAIEFCISSRPCLTAAAEVDADLEDEDDEDVISRCVDEVLAILDVVVVLLLDEEDTLELLLLEAAFRSFFVRFLGNLSRMILYSQVVISLRNRSTFTMHSTYIVLEMVIVTYDISSRQFPLN